MRVNSKRAWSNGSRSIKPSTSIPAPIVKKEEPKVEIIEEEVIFLDDDEEESGENGLG